MLHRLVETFTVNKKPVVRAHSAVNHANVGGDLFYLAGGELLEQDGLVLLLRGQHNAVHSLTNFVSCCKIKNFFGTKVGRPYLW